MTDELGKIMLRSSFKMYVENRLFRPMTNQEKYIITPYHLKCINTVQDHEFSVIEAYRGFGKSELISYSWVLWRAEMYNESAIIFSANEDLAYQKLDLIRNCIEIENPSLNYMCSKGISGMTWNRGEIWLINKNDPIYMPDGTQSYRIMAKLYARSIKGTSRGLHVKNIVGDDIVVEDNSSTYEMKEQTKKQFYAATIPIRVRNSRMVVIGTPQSDDDLLSDLAADTNKYWAKCIIPVTDNLGRPSCPELGHDAHWITQQRALQGELAFQQEYQLKVIDETSSIFKWEFLNKAKMLNEIMMYEHVKRVNEIVVLGTDYAVVDSKIKAEKNDTDYFAMVVLSYNTISRKRRVLNIYRERGIKFSSQLAMTRLWMSKYQCDYLAIETHGFLDTARQELEAELKDVPIFDTGSKAGKFDKYTGIPSMLYAWEKDFFEVPYADTMSQTMANILFGELNELGKSAHDDVADALFRAEKVCSGLSSTATYDKNFSLYPRHKENQSTVRDPFYRTVF